jgi:hypothetical protein
MQYVALLMTIALSAGVALAESNPMRVQPTPRSAPPEQTTSAPPPMPPPPPPPPPVTQQPAQPPTPLALPSASSSAAKAVPAEDTDDEPDRPGWTGVVAGFGLGSMTPPSTMQPRRSYVAIGMEVHWERPRGLVRPGIILRPDLLMIANADEMNGSRPRLDLAAMGGVGIGETLYARVAAGPLATKNVVIKGVDRFRGGVLVEVCAGWRRIGALYAEARKTWGNDITDLGVTFGVRLDLALLSRLN